MVAPSHPRQIGRRGAAHGQRDAAIARAGDARSRRGAHRVVTGGDRAIASSAHAGAAAEQDSGSSAAVRSAATRGEHVENVPVDLERMPSKLPDFMLW